MLCAWLLHCAPPLCVSILIFFVQQRAARQSVPLHLEIILLPFRGGQPRNFPSVLTHILNFNQKRTSPGDRLILLGLSQDKL